MRRVAGRGRVWHVVTMSTHEPQDPVTISAAEANRGFSKLLREVREGRSFVVTSHGRPVARLGPWLEDAADPRAHAREGLIARLNAQPAAHADAWTRDELHAR